MKTAVEWLVDEHFGGVENCTPDFRFHIQQALEIEKEQIKKSYSDGSQWELYGCDLTHEERSEEYYNEIFKQEQ